MTKGKFTLMPGREGIFDTLNKQVDNIFKERYNLKVSETDKSTRTAVHNLCISIANHCNMGKMTNFSTKHAVCLTNDMKELGYSIKIIKDTISRLQDFSRTAGCKKPLVASKDIFSMCEIGKREDPKLERAFSDREYSDFIKKAREMGREDVVLAFKISKNFGTRLEGTITLSPRQIESALVKKELIVIEKGGKIRHIAVETAAQVKMLKEAQAIYKREGLKAKDIIFRDSKFLNQGKKTRNGNNVGKCMDAVQSFIYRYRDEIQDKDRKDLKDRNGNSIQKASLTFHGLRYTNAREKYIRERLKGRSVAEAQAIVSVHLGHGKDRKDVTEVYLKEIEKEFIENLDYYKQKYGYK